MTEKTADEKVFGIYSDYYDLLYSDKDYRAEAEFVLNLLGQSSPGAVKIADFGCGTGRHAIEFASKGLEVTGVELSKTMLEMAERNLSRASADYRGIRLVHGDVRGTDTGEKYDCIFMLFHVLGYLNKNEELKEALRNAGRHLVQGGILIFDFWYGPAVLGIKPEHRTKNLENSEVSIVRFASPRMIYAEDVVEVTFSVEALRKSSGEKTDFEEVHRMRYFFIPELELLLNDCGFEPLNFCEWMTGEALTENSWSGVCTARYGGGGKK